MLYYEIDGPAEAQTIILSNSLGTTLEMWDPQMDALTKHFRIIRFDHRGHGRSPVNGECSIADLGGDVLELLDELKMPVVSFAGLSLGGIPGSRLVVLPGAAHLANVERPDAVSQHLIRHFLEE
jgi:3-oxoadipate enol-lactonase